jgi:hypothetical protein
MSECTSGFTVADVKFWFVFGYSRASWRAIVINSAFAWSRDTPGLSRAITDGAALFGPMTSWPRGIGGN